MKSNRLTAAVTASLLFGIACTQVQAAPIPKQLAGPPSEFASMAPADLADAAIHSKSALLPIRLSPDKAGGYSWGGDLPIEGERARFLVFTGGALDWSVRMRSPDGLEKAASALATDHRQASFGIENASFPADYYAFNGIKSGNWALKLHAGSDARLEGFVLIEGESSTQLVSYQSSTKQLVGDRIEFVASLSSDSADGAGFGKSAGHAEVVTLQVTSPDGDITILPMFDDGKHGDGKPGDGIYGGGFVADKAGIYQAQVLLRGSNTKGAPIVRTAEHMVPVLEPSLQLSAAKASASLNADQRIGVRIPVAAEKASGHYRGYAEVWGTGSKGEPVAIAWIGGMVSPDQGALTMALDSRWIAKAGAQAPFELRNLRIEDPDYFVTLAGAKRMPISGAGIQVKAAAEPILVDESMLMGPRPVDSIVAEKGVGRRLLLVHGYCSGGVWPASQFSTASTFLDANQNRTHDQFARLIQSFGNTWNSFGVVAHSQGGAASLHLYTYYWSGLDNATGNRLIQSVGTPYQGTNLAGILATLGNWFGVGCGNNANLNYSGAASWLAGIPTWARGKVNYYTTSFRSTNWWTNDYCNFATDLVLSDPEDGTTEQVKGQVSGAINRGHTTGQCHTAGMRDPAQYLDATRNATMNSNAAR